MRCFVVVVGYATRFCRCWPGSDTTGLNVHGAAPPCACGGTPTCVPPAQLQKWTGLNVYDVSAAQMKEAARRILRVRMR